MDSRRNCLALLFALSISFVLIEETTQELPQHVWQMLKDSNISSTADFISKFLKKKPGSGHDIVGKPGSGTPVEGENILYNEEGSLNPDGGDIIASLVDIEKDKCEIKRVSHQIPTPPNEPNIIWWPTCVKLNQCSGCCNNEMMECAPIIEQSVEFTVLKARYPFAGADYFEFEGLKPLVFKQHLECECRCRIQPEHCTPGLHTYDPHSCQCQCYNYMDSMSCVHPMIWNNDECRCACPKTGRACYDDEEYNEDSCSCVQVGNGNVIGDIPPVDYYPNNGDIFCEKEISCRVGYRPQMGQDGECGCVMDVHGNMEGSLITGGRPTRRPRPNSGGTAGGAADVERVPDHPMYVVHEPTPAPTRAPRPPPRTHRPRRPRRQRRPHSHQ